MTKDTWAEEEAENLARELNRCCKHSRTTRCFQCSMKLIATALRSARNRGLEEAANLASQSKASADPIEIAFKIRALKEGL